MNKEIVLSKVFVKDEIGNEFTTDIVITTDELGSLLKIVGYRLEKVTNE